MKIVFFGSTNLGLPVLETLHASHEITAVVTTPDAPAGRSQEMQETPTSALARDLNLTLLKPDRVSGNADFLAQIRGLSADMFVLVAYGKILPADLINMPQYKTVNAHPSLLPKYRGPSPIKTALMNGDEVTGVTFIILDDQVDHGPVLGSFEVKIDPDDNDFTLTDKLARKAAENVNEVIQRYAAGEIVPRPQDESGVSYTKIVTKAAGKINWQKSAQEIYNQFRAFYPWPGIWTVWNGKMVKILDCVPSSQAAAGETVGAVFSDGTVACGNGSVLKINKLQLEGKNETDIKSFMNGYPQFVESVLDV